MAAHINWRIFFWLNTGLDAVVILLVIFLFPETKWHRKHPREMIEATTSDTNEKDTTTHEQLESVTTREAMSDLSPTKTAERDPYLGKGTPSRKQFRLFQPNSSPFQAILIDLWIPIKLHTFPIVELAAFMVSWSASCFLTLNLTQSQVFAASPYNLSSQSIGFFNFAVLVGALIGLSTNGYLSDWLSMKATRKNGGIREPEMRLPALIPYVLIMLLGNFIVAFGYQRQWPWQVSLPSTPCLDIQYLTDLYRQSSSLVIPALVSKSLLYLPSSQHTLSTPTSQSLVQSSWPLQSTRTYGDMDFPSSLPLGLKTRAIFQQS